MGRLFGLVLPALVFASPALAQQPRTIDGWTLTENATSCTATMGNAGERVTGRAAISAVPTSSDWPGRFAITIDITTIAALRDHVANDLPIEVQARLPSGQIVPLPSTAVREGGQLTITPRGFDRAYIAALTGEDHIAIEARIDQTMVRTPNPDAPYQRIFEVKVPAVDNLLAAMDACNARVRANRVPVVRVGLSDRIANSVCPFELENGYARYLPLTVPGGVYRLRIGTDGRIAETQAPASHATPADRFSPLRYALQEIPRHIRRLQFIPAFNASLEPVEAWAEFTWPVINCPADVRR